MGIVALGGWFSFGCLVLRLAVVLVADALRFGLLYYRFWYVDVLAGGVHGLAISLWVWFGVGFGFAFCRFWI